MNFFPESIKNLKKAALPAGATGYFMQGERNQILYVEFADTFKLPEHTHTDEFGVVVNGTLTLTKEGVVTTHKKGDTFYIPSGTNHNAVFEDQFAAIIYFDEPDRYKEAK